MKTKLIAISTLTAAIFSMSAGANDLYAGATINMIDYDEDGFSSLSLTALSGIFGIKVNENFSVEGRLGFGIGDDDINFLGETVTVEIDHYYGIYGRIGAQVEQFYPYVLLGYTRGESTASALGQSFSADDSDFSYGVGIDFNVSDTIAINAEYMNYLEGSEAGSDYEYSGFSLGARFAF